MDRDYSQTFNELVRTNKTLMPHQVAVALGCDLSQATSMLMLLAYQGLATLSMLVYHAAHDDIPIAKAGPIEAMSMIPFVCPECEETIDGANVYYDMLFEMVGER